MTTSTIFDDIVVALFRKTTLEKYKFHAGVAFINTLFTKSDEIMIQLDRRGRIVFTQHINMDKSGPRLPKNF